MLLLIAYKVHFYLTTEFFKGRYNSKFRFIFTVLKAEKTTIMTFIQFILHKLYRFFKRQNKQLKYLIVDSFSNIFYGTLTLSKRCKSHTFKINTKVLNQ